MKTTVKLSVVLLAGTMLAGCAGSGSRDEPHPLLCATAGALAGGAGVAAVASGGSTGAAAAGGAVAGALIGMMLCPQPETEAAPMAAAAAVCAVEPPPGALLDSQGCATDGDGDGIVTGVDLCLDTPEGVTVDMVGCPLDEDFDAVPDYLDLCPGTEYGAIVDPDGCPLQGQVLLVIEGINFAFDSNELDLNSQDMLDDAAIKLNKTDAVLEVRVEGHTDSTGSEEYNMDLSLKRAQAVIDYLATMGVSSSSLIAVGMGESVPVMGNDTADGRAANRRVEFVVVE